MSDTSPSCTPWHRTFLSLDEISAIEVAMAAPGYVPNTAQRRLAEEVRFYSIRNSMCFVVLALLTTLLVYDSPQPVPFKIGWSLIPPTLGLTR